jgi:tetratricopeptide (TPR) repeat protein
VPTPLPIDPARAVYFLERAGELASSAGAYAEARDHVLSAIDIAQPEERSRLYEKLGDSVGFGDGSTEAYRQALELWRATGELDPLGGARLMRKLLIIYMRWQGSVTNRQSELEIVDMRTEARRLAEAAGDEDELWRFKVADLYWPFWRGNITTAEVAEGRAVGQAAAQHFEGRQEWEMYHVALDGYTSIVQLAGDHGEAVAAANRRLSAPMANQLERGDAVNMLVWSLVNSGEYDRSIDVMERTLAELRPGEPRITFSNGVAFAALAACFAGRWDDLRRLVGALQEAWEELRRDAGAGFLLAGFFSALHVAIARQDRAATDMASAVIERLLSVESRAYLRPLLDAYLADDPGRLDLDQEGEFWHRSVTNPIKALGFMFLSERGVVLPKRVLEDVTSNALTGNVAPIVQAVQTSRALSAKDPAELAQAIDRLAAHGFIPHAARMRIILAEMTGDSAPLEQARSVLERLEDRQFLRRMEEVTASFQS